MARSSILRWVGIVCFSFIASVLHGSGISTDLSADGCTLYIGEDSRIRRVDLCRGQTLADFNAAALPDNQGAQQIRILPDGGMLVANVSVIAQLDAGGQLTGTYDLDDHDCWSGVTLDKRNTSFLAWSSCTSEFVRFELNGAAAISAESRMFGGGTSHTSTRVQVNYGMDLHCAATTQPNYLQVVWGGNVFFMQTITSVSCSGAPFNTITGAGAGTINGQAAATVEWTLVDGGNPGVWKDTARIVVRDALGEVVVEVAGRITNGSNTARE